MARILFAEDEDPSRAPCARALCSDGHDVAMAGGGEAFDVLTREQGHFDLLLTDICMPIIDGIALALAAAHESRSNFVDDPAPIARAQGCDAPVHEVLALRAKLAEPYTAQKNRRKKLGFFRTHAAQPYDERIRRFSSQDDRVSIWTLVARQKIAYLR